MYHFVYFGRNCHLKGNIEEHPCMPVVAQLWDIIQGVIYNYQQNVRVIERSCRYVNAFSFADILYI